LIKKKVLPVLFAAALLWFAFTTAIVLGLHTTGEGYDQFKVWATVTIAGKDEAVCTPVKYYYEGQIDMSHTPTPVVLNKLGMGKLPLLPTKPRSWRK
jgi:hypothetical protein